MVAILRAPGCDWSPCGAVYRISDNYRFRTLNLDFKEDLEHLGFRVHLQGLVIDRPLAAHESVGVEGESPAKRGKWSKMFRAV